jgi:hypothetical protein
VIGSFPTEEQAAQAYLGSISDKQPWRNAFRPTTSPRGFLLRAKNVSKQGYDSFSKYTGVTITAKPFTPFQARIQRNRVDYNLGWFPTEEGAALAYLKEHLKQPKGEDVVVDDEGLLLRPSPKPGQSKYFGVHSNNSKWKVFYQHKSKTKYLGTYDTEVDAARAYLELVSHTRVDNFKN